MTNQDSDLANLDDVEAAPKCIVRLTTSYWHDCNGIYSKKSLRFQKRLCVGHNFVHEDAQMINADAVMSRIINLSECDDGLYQVVTCNERSDWETPHIMDDYDYKLVPTP